jgi:hypothetical protein
MFVHLLPIMLNENRGCTSESSSLCPGFKSSALAALAPGLNKTFLIGLKRRRENRTSTQKPILSTKTDMDVQSSVPNCEFNSLKGNED